MQWQKKNKDEKTANGYQYTTQKNKTEQHKPY
jgi:hypothetical protein